MQECEHLRASGLDISLKTWATTLIRLLQL
jgi:hypothetical protein